MVRSILAYLCKCVEKCPNKRAVAYRDRFITFEEMAHRAKKYSQIILDLSPYAAAPRPIGVICSRDIEPIIAFLGVIYSKNFYVPLDINAPKEKIKSIVEDANIDILIGTADQNFIIEEIGFSGKFIAPEDLSKYPDTEIQNIMCVPDIPEDYPLYMVYTSGSTGKPKGVLKSHKAEISYIEAFCDTFRFCDEDIIGNQTPFYFDAAAKDIYLMLKLGITMEIIPTEYFPLPPELIQYINSKRITIASWVPTVLSIVAQLNPFSEIKPETLKKIFFVGEVMPMKHLNIWRKTLPNIQYINLYGQSELCGICCYYEVKEDFPDNTALPIGMPLKNCQIHLVDNGTVVNGPGKTGEIYIVSDALATEYYNDPEKTKNSFVMKDFGNGIVRSFRTGDLAQYDTEGNLVFVSRADFQIKHMGHRIELGEIETVANSLQEVARCCCLYNSDKKRIILFCELSSGSCSSGAEIKSILKNHLSSYMVPWKVIVMDKLPLNANGKIDRQKLKSML